MPGLVPGIHALQRDSKKDVDGRDKPGHDERFQLICLHRRHVLAILHRQDDASTVVGA